MQVGVCVGPVDVYWTAVLLGNWRDLMLYAKSLNSFHYHVKNESLKSLSLNNNNAFITFKSA